MKDRFSATLDNAEVCFYVTISVKIQLFTRVSCDAHCVKYNTNYAV